MRARKTILVELISLRYNGVLSLHGLHSDREVFVDLFHFILSLTKELYKITTIHNLEKI